MLVAYVPVLHKGYLELFKKYPTELALLGSEIIADYTSLTRDVRAVDPEDMKCVIESLGIFKRVRILTKNDLASLASTELVMPDEDVSRAIVAQYFPQATVEFASIFLRWDKMLSTVEHVIPPNRTITTEAAAQEIMRQVEDEALKSSDWWRQNGAIIVKDDQVLAQIHNRHLPTDWHLMQNGDPRSNFDAGQRYDLSTAIHAEAAAIAQCARRGTSVEGTWLYCTTFPCPACAKLVAESGIKKVFYQKGYSLLDSEEILKLAGVEIVLVQ